MKVLILLIERYVIIDEADNIIESVDDLPFPLEKCKHGSTLDGRLRVYDRMISKTIARLFTPDLEINFKLASAIIAELNIDENEIDV